MPDHLRTLPRFASRHERRPVWLRLDPYLIFSALSLSALGILMIYSVSRGFDTPLYGRQTLFVGVGFILMLAVGALDFSKIYTFTPFIYGTGIFALLLVLTDLGSEHRDSQAWFDVGSFQIQPSEFMKLGTILMLAWILSKFNGRVSFGGLIGSLIVLVLPVILILFQPDVGTVLVYGVIGLVMLTVGGLQSKHLLVLLMVMALALALIFNSNLLQDFQKNRLEAFVNPANETVDAYNQTQAQIAVGNGGLFGQGFGGGSQTRGQFVPEQHTDFIFTVIGEELGFWGGSLTIGLFALLIWRVWKISSRSGDMFALLVCTGVIAMILFQTFESIGMALGIMPITGIPMPLVSYGGSSMLTNFLAIGMVLSVAIHRYPQPVKFRS